MVHIPYLTSAWDPQGKHCLITGGSQGLGLAVGQLLASRGADVTIVARSESKLEKAVKEIESARRSPDQLVSYFSADVSTFTGAHQALDWCQSTSSSSSPTSSKPVGRVPDAVFCCAGGAKPGYFIDQTEEDFQAGIKTDYMTALSSAHAAASTMAKTGKKGKIILVSSTLGLMGLVGYSQYSPMKFAIRGLAETLRSEMLLYGITVHCYFPGTILSPGYEQENRTKPELTKKLEGGPEEGLTPKQCAEGLINGLAHDRFFITTDFQTELFRAAGASGGSIPGNGWLLDRVKAFIALIGLPIWRRFDADRQIKSYSQTHASEVRIFSWSYVAAHPYSSLLIFSIFHRLLVLLLLLSLPLALRPFDTSSQLQLLLNDGHAPPMTTRLLSNLVRWDSIHFLGLASPVGLPDSDAQGGYQWEHSLAFQPGIIWLLRLVGLSFGGRWSPASSIAIVSMLSSVVSSLTPMLLFHILLPLLPSSTALVASLLSILSPSPSTLVTPTPESFFAFASLLGLAILSPVIDYSTLRPTSTSSGIPNVFRLILASICFGIAAAFRANGLLLVGYLWYAALWSRPISGQHWLLRASVLPFLSFINACPFLLGQYWAHRRFCQDESAARPWCHGGMRSVYSFVQAEYWNVGFLRYWELAQIPNFLLADPVLLLASYASLHYYRSSPAPIFKHTFFGWLPSPSTLNASSQLIGLIPHLHLSTLTTLLLLFNSHVQISLRFASSAWVGVWVGVGLLFQKKNEGNARWLQWICISWLVGWNLVSIILYAAFLPPA